MFLLQSKAFVTLLTVAPSMACHSPLSAPAPLPVLHAAPPPPQPSSLPSTRVFSTRAVVEGVCGEFCECGIGHDKTVSTRAVQEKGRKKERASVWKQMHVRIYISETRVFSTRAVVETELHIYCEIRVRRVQRNK
jgi:hypothetical protein